MKTCPIKCALVYEKLLDTSWGNSNTGLLFVIKLFSVCGWCFLLTLRYRHCYLVRSVRLWYCGRPPSLIRLIILNCFHCLTDKVKDYVLELLSQNKPFLPWIDSSDLYHRNKKRNLKPYLANEASGHFNIETVGHTNLYIHIIWFGVLMFIHIYIIICLCFFPCACPYSPLFLFSLSFTQGCIKDMSKQSCFKDYANVEIRLEEVAARNGIVSFALVVQRNGIVSCAIVGQRSN